LLAMRAGKDVSLVSLAAGGGIDGVDVIVRIRRRVSGTAT
jgi:hypothetical protein